MWLLDTVALSEATKPHANPGFLSWLETVSDDRIFTSVLCLGEIRRGVEMLPAGIKKDRLASWLEIDLPAWLGDRILPPTTSSRTSTSPPSAARSSRSPRPRCRA
jgi:predicted nucleic acid-binding protein